MNLSDVITKRTRINELEILMDQFPDSEQMSQEMYEAFTKYADEHATLVAELREAGLLPGIIA